MEVISYWKKGIEKGWVRRVDEYLMGGGVANEMAGKRITIDS